MTRIIGDADREMQMAEGFLLYPLMVDLRFRKWDHILATPEPNRRRELLHAFWRYARAMAFAGQGKVREARAEQKKFARLRAKVTPDMQYIINNRAASLLDLAAATLEAELA